MQVNKISLEVKQYKFVCMSIYLRTASVVFTPNQNLVTLEETERMRIKTNRDRERARERERNKSFTDKSCV